MSYIQLNWLLCPCSKSHYGRLYKCFQNRLTAQWWSSGSTQGPQFALCPREIRCWPEPFLHLGHNQRGRKQVCSTTSNRKVTIDTLGPMESPVGAQFSKDQNCSMPALCIAAVQISVWIHSDTKHLKKKTKSHFIIGRGPNNPVIDCMKSRRWLRASTLWCQS